MAKKRTDETKKQSRDQIAQSTASPAPARSLSFLDLDYDIRIRIYRALFIAEDDMKLKLDPQTKRHGFFVSNHGIQANILRVNKQIYEEAKAEMIKENLFVIVSSNVEDFERFFAHQHMTVFKNHLHVLDATHGSLGNTPKISGAVMHMIMSSASTDINETHVHTSKPPSAYTHLLILHRKLSTVLSAMSDIHALWLVKHELAFDIILKTNHAIYAGTPNAILSKNGHLQEKILAPFFEQRYGWRKVHIQGSADSQLAERLMMHLSRDPYECSSETFRRIVRLKEDGNDRHRTGNYFEADELYRAGQRAVTAWLSSIRGRRTLALHYEREGDGFFIKVAELHMTLNLNAAISAIAAMRAGVNRDTRNGNDVSIWVKYDGIINKVVQYIDFASSPAKWLGLAFNLSDQQRAKILYTTATLYELIGTERYLVEAVDFANQARIMRPNDATIHELHQRLYAKVQFILGG